jgi:hypothetical protein
MGSRWMVEARGQYESGAQAAGGRIYRYLFPSGRIYPYLGIEGDVAEYTIEGVNENGYLGEAFAGLEYFIWKKLSLQFDFGPAYVGLNGDNPINGIRYVVNFGFTYYF